MTLRRTTTLGWGVLLALVLLLALSATALAADGRIVQNDPDNPIKFSIDAAIANGSVSTPDLYIGTVRAYLGDKADGRTPVFEDGFGTNPNDILIMNDRVGIVLAVGTPDPWGYPGGSILDAGRVDVPAGAADLKGATFGKDTVLTNQFLFNRWDAWAPVNAGIVYFDLVKYDFEAKRIDEANGVWAVQANRKFAVPYNLAGVSIARDLDVVTYYSIPTGADYAYMFDTIQNNGVAFAANVAQNAVSLSNKGGDGIDTKTVAALTAANTYNWVEGPGGEPTRAFSTTIISPGENLGSDGRTHPFAQFRGAPGYRELHFSDLAYIEGEERLYESYLMIDDECSWQKVYDFWADYKGLDTFNVSGSVTDADGEPVAYPVVVAYRGDALHGWVMGDEAGLYSMDLPNENATQEYQLQAEKSGTAPGAKSAAFTSATVPAGGVDLQTGARKVPVTFNFVDQNDEPVWGRVSVGPIPTIAFTGKNYFFCDNAPDGSVTKGQVTAMVAPGDYSATCYGEGFGFYSYTSTTSTYSQVVTGNTTTDAEKTVVIQKPLSAPVDWFGIDNHHHGIRSDAFSPPEVAAKAQITAGLEVLTLDDHDFVLDNIRVYEWAREMAAFGYMPSLEVTPSWAHFDVMPLTRAAYERFLDRDQENRIVDTNASLQGILDDAHNAGVAIGANHPNQSYGLFLADDDKTVPGGMSDDFDGIEAQFRVDTLGEAMSFWNAYVTGGSHRGVEVKRPHYIYASTDIHESGIGTGSGARRSYVFVDDGAAKSAADFEEFSIEFGQNQAAGQSFSSSGVFVVPTSGKLYGKTYRTDATGGFTATFNVSALNPITTIYVFGSTGTGTGTAPFSMNNLVSQTTYTGGELSTSKDFTLSVDGIQGKQWYAIAARSSANQLAFTNPIWVEGPDVPAPHVITAVTPIITPPVLPVTGRVIEQPPTAIMTTFPWSGFLLADWTLSGGNFNAAAKPKINYIYTLTFTAPPGFVFDRALNEGGKDGRKVSNGGTTLTYRVQLKALPKAK